MLQWYASFEVARVGILASHGFNASVGQFSTGTPDITQPAIMNAFAPAIDAVLKHGGVLNGQCNRAGGRAGAGVGGGVQPQLRMWHAVHEYSSPTLDGCFDNATQTGWLTGRYRKWYEQLLVPQGRVPPLVISEMGIDNACGTEGLGGWKGTSSCACGRAHVILTARAAVATGYCAWWKSNLPWHPADCNHEYVQELAWYDSIIREDAYVLGATIFCLDIPGWDQYDITPAVPDLVAYMNSV